LFAGLVWLEAASHGKPPAAPLAARLPAPDLPQNGQWVRKNQGWLPMPAQTPAAHASSLLAMLPGHRCALQAYWFAGERESAADVQIASACFERSSQQWSAAHFVVNRHAMGDLLGFGLRRLGNPVPWLDASGRVHLFVVATGPGGWAASRVVHVRQAGPIAISGDAASAKAGAGTEAAFEQPRVLPLAWWWNVSHLVRGAPLALADGGMVLPVYFELGVKYPVALRFDANGGFEGMTRMSGRRGVLQPSLLALNATHWLALMRDNRVDGKIAVVQTGDGGQTWRDMRDLNLINPDAAVAATAIGPWHFMLAHNSSPKTRQVLQLSESGNGIDWVPVHTLASGGSVTSSEGHGHDKGLQTRAAEFSYPALVWADGSLWVTYTENRTRIAWQQFVMQKPP
jgi:predicted neuraminidase